MGGVFASIWTDATGAYRNEWGGILSVPVTTPGSYTVAPSVVMPAANGFATARVNATATVSLSGGGLGTVTITNLGKAYLSATNPTLSGGTGSGGVLGAPVLQGFTLQERFAGTTGGSGSGPWLLRNTGAIGQNQRIEAEFIMSATTDRLGLVVRLNSSVGSCYAVNFASTVGQIFRFLNNYNGAGTGTAVNLGSTSTFTAPAAGHTVRVVLDAISTSVTTTSITCTIYNVTLGTTLGTRTVTDSTSDLQSVGQCGVGFTQNTGTSVRYLRTYNDQGVVLATPTSMAAGSTQTINCVGAGVNWTLNPPTLSGIGGVTFTINSQSASDATHYSFNVTLGTTAGILTVTDSSTIPATFINLAITGIVPGVVTLSSVTETGCNIASTAPQNGTPPFLYEIFASPQSAQVCGVSPSVLIHSQSGIAGGVAPADFLYTTAPSGPLFIRGRYTDSAAVAAQSGQKQCVIPTVYSGVTMGFFGDSTVEGSSEIPSLWYDRIGHLQIGAGGTGYSNSGLVVTISGGTFTRQAVAGVPFIVGGVIQYIPLTDPGEYSDPNNAPTVVISGGSGSGASVTAVVGGGKVCALEKGLHGLYGISTGRLKLGARAGSVSANFLPNGTVYNVPPPVGGTATNPYYFYECALAQFGSPSVCPYIYLDFGANDCNNGFHLPAAYFIDRITKITDALLLVGYKVIFDPPWFRNINVSLTADEASLLLLQQYGEGLVTLAAAYELTHPGQVFLAPGSNYLLVMQNLGMLYDGLHPGVAGYGLGAIQLIEFIGQRLGFIPPVPTVGGYPRQFQ